MGLEEKYKHLVKETQDKIAVLRQNKKIDLKAPLNEANIKYNLVQLRKYNWYRKAEKEAERLYKNMHPEQFISPERAVMCMVRDHLYNEPVAWQKLQNKRFL